MHSGLAAIIEGLPYILGGIGVTLTVVGGALAMGLANDLALFYVLIVVAGSLSLPLVHGLLESLVHLMS